MPSTSAGRSPSPHDASPARTASFLSRLKFPVGGNTRHIEEFDVRPDDPHRLYGQGEVITGNVILKVIKPLRVTHITVCLHGFVQVYKAANNPGESYRAYTGTSTPGKTTRTGYFGNGFASLFQDEVALCGEGRLGEGTYQFGFELMFPKTRLPSSIDFERGTVAYMITCTLTKPTAIAPTSFCDTKINFGEDVNIASLQQPKPRVVTLEPIRRPKKSKHAARHRSTATTESDQKKPASTAGSDASAAQRSSVAGCSQADADSVMSPSEASLDSCVSSCGPESAMDSAAQSALSKGGSRGAGDSVTPSQGSIIASIQLSRAGYLRGDTVQLRVSVQHTKVVRSLHGIIVTFYRQARVDMHPALPVITKDGKQEKAEDYYPRSKTGLGGLSLSAAGSTHVYRKDMSQSFAPLLINPDTMNADVKAAVRVPEDAFPTISSVPGQMISFRYYVEVILDLQGKLSGLDRLFPSSGTRYGPGAGTNVGDGVNDPMLSAWGGHLIDTQDIRREKSVVSCVFEVVLGTRDSDRLPGQRIQQVVQVNEQGEAVPQSPTNADADPARTAQQIPDEDPTPYEYNYGNGEGYDDYGYGNEYGYGYANGYHYPSIDQSMAAHPPAQPPIPLPDLQEEEQLPEKERLWRAEARLLPSQPPEADDGGAEASNSAPRDIGPSAPALDVLEPYAAAAPPFTDQQGAASGGGGQATLDRPGEHNGSTSGAAAPAYFCAPDGPSATAPLPPTDDKQELHRRRLEMERSAPDDDEGPEIGAHHRARPPSRSTEGATAVGDGVGAGAGAGEGREGTESRCGGAGAGAGAGDDLLDDEDTTPSAPPALEVQQQQQQQQHEQLPRYER